MMVVPVEKVEWTTMHHSNNVSINFKLFLQCMQQPWHTKGDVEIEVTEPLRGWGRLKVGSKVKGRLVSIKNR